MSEVGLVLPDGWLEAPGDGSAERGGWGRGGDGGRGEWGVAPGPSDSLMRVKVAALGARAWRGRVWECGGAAPLYHVAPESGEAPPQSKNLAEPLRTGPGRGENQGPNSK